jgi:hypothetical protein
MAPRRVPAAAPAARLPGAPVAASAAATEPMAGAKGGAPGSGFYSPEPDGPSADERTLQPGAAAAFREQVQRESIVVSERGGTADVEVAGRVAMEHNDTDESLAETIARIRATRKPLGAYSQKLALAQRQGYHRHWFNDVAGRIDEAKASGYAHVVDADGKPICRAVGSGRDKGVLYAYAMEIPKVFFEEDQAAKHKMASDQLDALKGSPFRAPAGSAQKSDAGKFYDPVETGSGPLTIEKSN